MAVKQQAEVVFSLIIEELYPPPPKPQPEPQPELPKATRFDVANESSPKLMQIPWVAPLIINSPRSLRTSRQSARRYCSGGNVRWLSSRAPTNCPPRNSFQFVGASIPARSTTG